MQPCGAVPTRVTTLYVFAVINLTLLLNLGLVEARVLLVNISKFHNTTIWEAADDAAAFGPPIPSLGIYGPLVYIPNDGCSAKKVQPPPSANSTVGWIAMIKRGNCPFDEKVYAAQQKHYIAVIIHNVGSDSLIPMGPGSKADMITIPSVFIGESNAMRFKNYQKDLNYFFELTSEFPPHTPIFTFLIPFVIVVGICFILMLAFMVVRWVRDIRRRRRSRLSGAHLKKIPVKKFKKGDKYDMCAICLDDYDEGDKLRILPCSHAYHQKCIDPWLTKNKKTCPICKRKVIPGHNSDSDSDSDEENGNVRNSENTPLLGAAAAGESPSRTRGGTFDNSGLPATVRNEVHPLSFEDSSDDESYTASTSNYQSSVDVHQTGNYGTQNRGDAMATVTIANETQSSEYSDSDDSESELLLQDPRSAATGGVSVERLGLDNAAFAIVDNHFGDRQGPTVKVGCINEISDDASSKSSFEGDGPPGAEDDVHVSVIDPSDGSPRQRDRIV